MRPDALWRRVRKRQPAVTPSLKVAAPEKRLRRSTKSSEAVPTGGHNIVDMSTISRRTFAQAAALLPLLRSQLSADPLRRNNLGVQLYTVRDVIMKNPLAILKAIQEIGYTEVEAVYANLDSIWPALRQTSLKAVSAHVDGSVFLNPDKSQLDHTLSDLKHKGFEYVVFPYVANNLRGNAETYKHMADEFNEIGRRVKGFDLQFCYHNHAFDFQPLGDNETPLKLLLATDPSLVKWEMDIFWVSVAGHDPVKMLEDYGDRIPLLHLKNKAKGTPVQYNENVPHDDFKDVGSGVIDVPAVLKAAQSGVKHYFVEQDFTPGNPIDSLRKSYEYLHEYMAKS